MAVEQQQQHKCGSSVCLTCLSKEACPQQVESDEIILSSRRDLQQAATMRLLQTTTQQQTAVGTVQRIPA